MAETEQPLLKIPERMREAEEKWSLKLLLQGLKEEALRV